METRNGRKFEDSFVASMTESFFTHSAKGLAKIFENKRSEAYIRKMYQKECTSGMTSRLGYIPRKKGNLRILDTFVIS